MKNKTLIYTAIAIPSALLWFYIFWIPLKTDALETGTLKARHFNPFYNHPEPAYYINPDTLPEVVAHVPETEPADIKEETVKIPVNYPYHLIVGSFQFPENAARLKESLWTQGYDSTEILSTNIGFNRVSIASYATYDEVFQAWKQHRNGSYPDAWVLKVRQ